MKIGKANKFDQNNRYLQVFFSKKACFIWLFLIALITIDIIFSKKSELDKNTQPAPAVSTMVVRNQFFQDTLQAIGTVKAKQSVQLTVEMPGVVENIYFYSGQSVLQGQLLVDLHAEDIQANLDKLQAKLDHDKKNNIRSKRLLKEKVISIADSETAEAMMKQDQAEVNQAQALLNKYHIRAPFSGLLGISQINIGQYLIAGQTINTLEQLSSVYVDFPIPERLLGQIDLSNQISVCSDAYPNQIFLAHLLSTSNMVDVNSRSALIRVEIDNPNKKLLSGMAVTVTIKEKARNAVVIPESAIVYDPEGSAVFLLDKKNIVHRQFLSFTHQSDGFAVVGSGLKPGDIILTSGQQAVHDGALVRMNNEDAAFSSIKTNNL